MEISPGLIFFKKDLLGGFNCRGGLYTGVMGAGEGGGLLSETFLCLYKICATIIHIFVLAIFFPKSVANTIEFRFIRKQLHKIYHLTFRNKGRSRSAAIHLKFVRIAFRHHSKYKARGLLFFWGGGRGLLLEGFFRFKERGLIFEGGYKWGAYIF